MRAAIYARVSTEDQARAGYSLPDQIATCRTRLLGMGITDTVEFVDDGYSGEFIDRPALTSMREDIAAGRINLVIVYDPDRLARNLSIQLLIANELELAKTPLHFCTGDYDASPEGKLFFSMRGAISEYEKAKILDRSMRGKRRKSTEGKIIQDFGLYGYTYDAENFSYIINEEQANIIKEIYNTYLNEQLSISGLQRALRAKVILSPTGKPQWSASTLHRVLTNRSYTGTFVSMKTRYKKSGINKRIMMERPEDEWVSIPIPVIIDEVTFERVQKQLKQHKTIRKREYFYPYLASGILYCGLCGRRMTVHQNVFNDTRKPYYRCATQISVNYRNAGIKCQSRTIPAESFDEVLWHEVLKAFNKPNGFKKFLPKVEPVADSKEIDRLIKLESELIKRREILARWFRQQMVSEQEAEAELLQIKQQLDDIQKRKTVIEPQPQQVDAAGLFEQFSAVVKRGDLDEEEKALIIHAVFSKITVVRTDKRTGTMSTRVKPDYKITWTLNV